jgi:hypothetical protein
VECFPIGQFSDSNSEHLRSEIHRNSLNLRLLKSSTFEGSQTKSFRTLRREAEETRKQQEKGVPPGDSELDVDHFHTAFHEHDEHFRKHFPEHAWDREEGKTKENVEKEDIDVDAKMKEVERRKGVFEKKRST